MKNRILLLLALLWVTACDNKQSTSGRVVIEKPAPVTISDSTGGVVELEDVEVEVPFNEPKDTVEKPVEIINIPAPKPIPAPIPQRVPPQGQPNAPPTVTVGTSINLSRLNNNLLAASKGDPFFKRVGSKAVAVGNDALKRPIQTVVSKGFDIRSIFPKNQTVGYTLNHFTSTGPYWHKQSNGTWKRIDGKGNGYSQKIGDGVKLQSTCTTILDLALAYKASGNQVFADRAVQHVQAFLLNPQTGMLPNLEFAQLVPAYKGIRVEAMVEAPSLVKVCDAMILLQGSKAYTPEVERSTKAWFAKLLTWMTTSAHGKEADKKLVYNIAALYELQLASYASFTGNDAFLAQRWPRVTGLLEHDLDSRNAFYGELERAKPNMYSNKALAAWVQIAKVYNQRGFNLWTWEKNGKSLKKAGLFLVPYMMGEKRFKPETVKPNYALDPFRTIHYTFREDEKTRKEFERFLVKYDGNFRKGNDTGALYEPFLKYW